MQPAAALNAIESVALLHRGGHRCSDGNWYNDNVGTRRPCSIRDRLHAAAEEVRALHASVHDAAHDTAAAVHVAEAMTGLVMADLPAEDAEGWTLTARMAIEGLAEYLDRDTSPAARRAEAAAALIRERAAGLLPTDPPQ